jgi:hypothetical protein
MPLTAAFVQLAEALHETQSLIWRIRRASADLMEAAAHSRDHVEESRVILHLATRPEQIQLPARLEVDTVRAGR